MSNQHIVVNHCVNTIVNTQNKPLNKINYLEIGIHKGNTISQVIKDINKIGVDPAPLSDGRHYTTYFMISDRFFKKNKKNYKMTFDIIFIDGMHQAEFVWRDFNNSLRIINKNGFIILDDIYPLRKLEQTKEPPLNYIDRGILKSRGAWTGDVWKFMYYLLLNHIDKFDFYCVPIHRHVGVVKPHVDISFNIGNFVESINQFDYKKDFKNYKRLLQKYITNI